MAKNGIAYEAHRTETRAPEMNTSVFLKRTRERVLALDTFKDSGCCNDFTTLAMKTAKK
jgi:hypothetical protein